MRDMFRAVSGRKEPEHPVMHYASGCHAAAHVQSSMCMAMWSLHRPRHITHRYLDLAQCVLLWIGLRCVLVGHLMTLPPPHPLTPPSRYSLPRWASEQLKRFE